MTDIRKLLQIVSESSAGASTAGAIASVANPPKQVGEAGAEGPKAPDVIEYGNWENSALTTSNKFKKGRDKAKKVVKSIYGEDSMGEAKSPEQQAAIAIAKKAAVKESVEAVKEQNMQEATLEEDDLILVPGQGIKRKAGFIPHGQSRVDHEVEMARSDLFQAGKNAVKVLKLIHDTTEEEGLEGWVQEKIIKAADYLNTVREYLEGKHLGAAHESMDGVGPSTRQFTSEEETVEGKTGPGLWANIHAKRERIKHGSGERMRKPGSKGAPKASDFKAAAGK